MRPGFLIASPQMRDPNFQRTVVLLAHHGSDGALGLIINRETQLRIGDLLNNPRLPIGQAGRLCLWGGPVEPGAGFVIFKGESQEGWKLLPDLSVSPSRERLEELVSSGQGFHLCLGYAGWGPGQLDEEFSSGSWVYIEPSADLVFDCPLMERYDRALSRLGVSAQSLWMTPIDE